jgi:hypothetical protein
MNSRDFSRRLVWGAAIGLIATIAYRSIQFVSVARAALRQECWTWQWLPFDAAWIWPYVSMFVLVGLPWFMLPNFRQVQRFAVCLLAIAALGWIVFMAYPTACVRPSADGQSAYYAMLLALDRPNNCLPCLHSAFSVLAVWALVRTTTIFRRITGAVFLAAWLVLICISIVALRQHTDGDMLAGFGLGCMGAWFFQFAQRAPEKT